MKFLPITLAAIAILGAPIPGSGRLALADPIEVTSPAGEEPANQVLEIPQTCDEEGSPFTCEQLSQSAIAEDAAAVANGNVAPAAADPITPPSSGELAASGVGTMQDYQNQADAGAAMISSAPYVVLVPRDPYSRPPMVLGNPAVVGPFVGGGTPFIPRMMPAPGRIGVTRPAWSLTPPPFTSMPMMGRPMAPAGMPQMLRLR
jgi:hypothetical protein